MLDNSELIEEKPSINETPPPSDGKPKKKAIWHCGNKECPKTTKPIPNFKGGGLPWCCSKECIKAARQQHKMDKQAKEPRPSVNTPHNKPRLSKDGLISAILSDETLSGDDVRKFMAIVNKFQ